MNSYLWPEQFTKHRGITGICKITNEVVLEEVEKLKIGRSTLQQLIVIQIIEKAKEKATQALSLIKDSLTALSEALRH